MRLLKSKKKHFSSSRIFQAENNLYSHEIGPAGKYIGAYMKNILTCSSQMLLVTTENSLILNERKKNIVQIQSMWGECRKFGLLIILLYCSDIKIRYR